ncbi:skin secretory protein xP2 isoform X2 [Dunckerocampus dactyliophorus]|uniref:skin secretory protein xP2 isoform X2 n=1 Tax=Dunckerocampus dactyliophorus TaxID=161453 RepID=UPI0024073656|nr:skin secretory protein xP2 isoform X2 [Dunckerocampus dactyliophorus]
MCLLFLGRGMKDTPTLIKPGPSLFQARQKKERTASSVRHRSTLETAHTLRTQPNLCTLPLLSRSQKPGAHARSVTMMSYLWILLLGSLLAGCAKTQDDEAPMEDATAPATLMPDGEVQGELETDGASEDTAEKTLPEPTEAAAHEQVTPAEGEAEPEAPSEADPEPGVPAEADPELEAPAEGETEPEAAAEDEPESPAVREAETAAEGEGEAAAPTEGEAEAPTEGEAEAPAAESEAATTTQGPPADPDVKDPEAEPHVPNVDEQPSASTDAPPAHEEGGSEVEATAGTATAVQHEKDESADVGLEEEAVANIDTELEVPTVKAAPPAPEVHSDGGFNLEDALSKGDAQDTPRQSGRSRSAGSGAHVAEATGEDAEGEETNSGSLAAILCALGVAIVGAATGYYTYQKKKLCFKNMQEEDPEAARKADTAEAQSDPQVLSNLLNSS